MKTDLTIRNAQDKDKLPWNNLVNHPLQSWVWGDFRQSMGVNASRLIVEKNNKPFMAWQIFFHKIPFFNLTAGYFPKGPDPDKSMLEKLIETGKKNRAVYIQIEPNVLKNKGHIPTTGYLKPSHHPLFTKYNFILDITKTEDELLKNMHPKTRYNLKIAQKNQIQIKIDNSEPAFNKYLELTEETARRQKFYAHNRLYHQKMWQAMIKDKIANLWTAKANGEIVTAWIIFSFKDTIYYPYGASSRKYREKMANYLLIWEIIKWAKINKYKYFDMWGALAENPDQNDPWFGFHRFKQGFGPEHIEYTGSYDLVISPVLYKLYITADKIRWAWLKLKKS